MKKHYEKNLGITYFFIIFLVLIFLFVVFLLNRKLIKYEQFSGVVFNTDTLVLVLNDRELELFYKNKVFYIDNKKKKFSILKIDKDILKRDGDLYNHVYIKTDISNMLKINDVVGISIMDKNVKCIKIFKIIWDGDLD